VYTNWKRRIPVPRLAKLCRYVKQHISEIRSLRGIAELVMSITGCSKENSLFYSVSQKSVYVYAVQAYIKHKDMVTHTRNAVFAIMASSKSHVGC
jgi:hypothetical protein